MVFSLSGLASSMFPPVVPATEAYSALETKFAEIGQLGAARESLGRLLLIDTPAGGMGGRQVEIAALTTVIQDKLRSPQLEHLLDSAAGFKLGDLTASQMQNLRAMRAYHTMETILPMDMAIDAQRIETEGRPLHSQAFKDNNWEALKPHLEQVVAFKREQGRIMAEKLGLQTPYDGLLQLYCPGWTSDQLETLFDDIVPELQELHEAAIARAPASVPPLEGHFPRDKQLAFFKDVLSDLGFDFQRGDLYFTAHNAVEGGMPYDAKITISAPGEDGASFLKALKSALHEGFHGIDYQGHDRQSTYQPVERNGGTDLQEAVALGEMVFTRSPEFNAYLAAKISGHFDVQVTPAHLGALRNKVGIGYDRKTADEIAYTSHVALRFYIEKDLINGHIKVEDLADEWNDAHLRTFGIAAEPDDYKGGVLQDVHWSVGKFGYFPAYALGLMMGAQLESTMRRTFDGDAPTMEAGYGGFRTGFIQDRISATGQRQATPQIIETVTGAPLNPAFLIAHLHGRYIAAPALQPEQNISVSPGPAM